MSVYPFLIITRSACSLSEYVCFCFNRFWNEFRVTSLASLTYYLHGDRPLATSLINQTQRQLICPLHRTHQGLQPDVCATGEMAPPINGAALYGADMVVMVFKGSMRAKLWCFLFFHIQIICAFQSQMPCRFTDYGLARWKTTPTIYMGRNCTAACFERNPHICKHLNYSSDITHKTILLQLCLFPVAQTSKNVK